MRFPRFVFAPVVALAILTGPSLSVPDVWAAGKEKVLYAFKGGRDGTTPVGVLVADAAGNLYGVTLSGGAYGGGTVFRLVPSDTGWKESVLHAFGKGDDGVSPYNLVLDGGGSIYGTTAGGGGAQKLCPEGCGVVYAITRDPQGIWSEKVVHRFQPEQGDGSTPNGALILDAKGNIYGTTTQGGTGSCNGGCGTAFEMTPAKDGSWNERVLYSFAGGDDGSFPYAGLLFGANGDMYGTTSEGGPNNNGTVFQLASSNGKRVKSTLYSFGGYPDGELPGSSSLVADKAGNLYGTTQVGGSFACGCCGCGTVFELRDLSGEWTENILHDFSGKKDDRYPFGPILDGAGNVCGTTSGSIHGQSGTVFELVASGSGWKERAVYAFRPGSDGYAPRGGVLERARDLYGVAAFGGDLNCGEGRGCGVVYGIVP